MSFLDRIKHCNTADIGRFLPFLVDGRKVGMVAPDFADRLAAFPDVFTVSSSGGLTLAAGLNGHAPRTRAVDRVLRRLADDGLIPNWRNEPYPVTEGFGQPALFDIERAAAARFGIAAVGVHMNGYVRKPDGLHIWVGRRAFDRAIAPGKLDQLVAGGQPAGLGLTENLAKECAEEAGIPADLAAKAHAVGAISYVMERPEGLRRDTLFLFDLELGAQFQPVNTDGEIAEFMLWSAEKVAAIVRDSDDFKFNCSLVVMDFLIRHGIITAENEPEYLEIIRGLHVGI